MNRVNYAHHQALKYVRVLWQLDRRRKAAEDDIIKSNSPKVRAAFNEWQRLKDQHQILLAQHDKADKKALKQLSKKTKVAQKELKRLREQEPSKQLKAVQRLIDEERRKVLTKLRFWNERCGNLVPYQEPV